VICASTVVGPADAGGGCVVLMSRTAGIFGCRAIYDVRRKERGVKPGRAGDSLSTLGFRRRGKTGTSASGLFNEERLVSGPGGVQETGLRSQS